MNCDSGMQGEEKEVEVRAPAGGESFSELNLRPPSSPPCTRSRRPRACRATKATELHDRKTQGRAAVKTEIRIQSTAKVRRKERKLSSTT